MFILFKIIKKKLSRIILNWMKEYTILKYGKKADVCFITTTGKGFLHFSTSNTSGAVPIEKKELIRKLVGQNILMIYGIPTKEEIPPNISLSISFSAIRQLGFKYFKFIKEWPGRSEVNGITVVTYSKR